MTYIAVIFMCLKLDCQVVSSKEIFKKEQTCLISIQQEEDKNKNKFDIFEARCIEIPNEFI
jgi:NADH:ubiquinone oxidoreductase subunit E